METIVSILNWTLVPILSWAGLWFSVRVLPQPFNRHVGRSRYEKDTVVGLGAYRLSRRRC